MYWSPAASQVCTIRAWWAGWPWNLVAILSGSVQAAGAGHLGGPCSLGARLPTPRDDDRTPNRDGREGFCQRLHCWRGGRPSGQEGAPERLRGPSAKRPLQQGESGAARAFWALPEPREGCRRRFGLKLAQGSVGWRSPGLEPAVPHRLEWPLLEARGACGPPSTPETRNQQAWNPTSSSSRS